MTLPPNPASDETPPGSSTGTPEPELPAWARRPTTSSELSDAQLEAFVGPKWETYRRKFAPFREDTSFVPTWNWGAAFPIPVWFLYRKLYLAFAAFFLLPNLALQWLAPTDTLITIENARAPENETRVLMTFAIVLSTVIAAGGMGNWLLYRRSRAAARVVAMQRLPEAESMALLRRVGGVNRGAAIFIIALTIVMIVAQIGA